MLDSMMNYLKTTAIFDYSIGNLVMFAIAGILIYFAVVKHAEPLLLIPIAFGIIIGNVPASATGIFEPPHDGCPGGLMWYIQQGLLKGVYPPLIFLGIGALTDFSFLLSNPKVLFLGAAAQVGIFFTFVVASHLGFSVTQSASIGIIGGADGPTSIFLSSKLAPELISIIAIAAYSYIALIPIIQPPIMKLLTTKKERMIRMEQLRHVSKLERIIFPVVGTVVVTLLVPKALPLIGMLMLGNLLKESGVVKRLVEAASRYILDSVTILLCVSVGSMARAETFLTPQSLKVVLLGAVAFMIATASGILFAKLMNLFVKNKVNPLIGAAGVSAVPDSARVAQAVAQQDDPTNFILMHAMGPNVAGVIGSAVAAGIFLAMLG